MRERVQRAMREVGYRSGTRGRSRRRALAIGALVPDATSSSFASVLQGAISVLSWEGHLLLTASSDENGDREVEEFRMLRRADIDGLLLTPRRGVPPEVETTARAGLPVVVMDRDGDCNHFDRVVMANCRNSFGAVRVLADRGHGRLTLVNGPSHDSTARERPRGYTDAFEQAGLALRQECVRLGTFSREHGRRAGSYSTRTWSFASHIGAFRNRVSRR